MKAHIGVYNVHDSHLLPKLLHGHETKAFLDSAYQQGRADHALVPRERDMTHPRYTRWPARSG
jgi:hypothetical protein